MPDPLATSVPYHEIRRNLDSLLIGWMKKQRKTQVECGRATECSTSAMKRWTHGRKELKAVEMLLLMEHLGYPIEGMPELMSKLRE